MMDVTFQGNRVSSNTLVSRPSPELKPLLSSAKSRPSLCPTHQSSFIARDQDFPAPPPPFHHPIFLQAQQNAFCDLVAAKRANHALGMENQRLAALNDAQAYQIAALRSHLNQVLTQQEVYRKVWLANFSSPPQLPPGFQPLVLPLTVATRWELKKYDNRQFLTVLKCEVLPDQLCELNVGQHGFIFPFAWSFKDRFETIAAPSAGSGFHLLAETAPGYVTYLGIFKTNSPTLYLSLTEWSALDEELKKIVVAEFAAARHLHDPVISPSEARRRFDDGRTTIPGAYMECVGYSNEVHALLAQYAKYSLHFVQTSAPSGVRLEHALDSNGLISIELSRQERRFSIGGDSMDTELHVRGLSSGRDEDGGSQSPSMSSFCQPTPYDLWDELDGFFSLIDGNVTSFSSTSGELLST